MPSIEESVTELQAILDRITAEAAAIAAAREALEGPHSQAQEAAETTAGLTAEAQAAISELEELATATAALSYSEKAEQVTAARETVEQAHAKLDTISNTLKEQAAQLYTLRENLTDLTGHLQDSQDAIEQSKQQLKAAASRSGSRMPVPAASSGASVAGQGEATNSVPKGPGRSPSHGTAQRRAGILSGPVKFSAPRKLAGKLTSDHRLQAMEYVEAANQALQDNALSSTGRVRPSRDPNLKNAKDAAARRERDRAAAAGQPYGDKVAAHLPDTTWTGTADPPGGWGRHDEIINSSLGSQSDKYPVGYRPEGFGLDETWDDTIDQPRSNDEYH